MQIEKRKCNKIKCKTYDKFENKKEEDVAYKKVFLI